MKWQSRELAIEAVERCTGERFTLLPCPHCGHPANLTDPEKDPNSWGGYRWAIVCSSSHCRAQVQIVADGWSEQLDRELNKHIEPNRLYRDRVTTLRDMWNRRVKGEGVQ